MIEVKDGEIFIQISREGIQRVVVVTEPANVQQMDAANALLAKITAQLALLDSALQN